MLYDGFKFKFTANAVKTKKLDFVTAMGCNSFRMLHQPRYFMFIVEKVKDDERSLFF
jgi:hypothetical protein